MRLPTPVLIRVLPALAAGSLLIAACGSDDPEEAEAPADTAADESDAPAETAAGDPVTISDFSYMPDSLTVAPGAEVTWENADSTAHTATAEGEAFDTGSIQPGEQGTATAPDEPGEYPYTCSFHPSMSGTLVVE